MSALSSLKHTSQNSSLLRLNVVAGGLSRMTESPFVVSNHFLFMRHRAQHSLPDGGQVAADPKELASQLA